MACTAFRYETQNGPVTGFVCGPRRRVARCAYCTRPHTHLCDFRLATGKDCNKKLCYECRYAAPTGGDFCPDHAPQVQIPLFLSNKEA